MYITNINIENFTVFKEISINFSKGINIIIGENGTGKTHLMKIMYASTSDKNYKPKFYKNVFTSNSDIDIKNYFRKDKKKAFEVNLNFSDKSYISFTDNSQNFNFKNSVNSIFIPTTEMLSHSNGFLSLEREREISFDKTLVDIVSKSQLGKIKELNSFNEKILKKISKIIGGKVIFEKDTFFIVKKYNRKIEFSMEGEGIKKLGVLWKLIQNGSINENTILFWDEPEANINPKYIPDLVEILLELQKSGIQIFVTTHNYIFSKYFDVKRSNENEIKYFSLYKNDEGTEYEEALKLENLQINEIRDTFIKLYEDDIERAMKE